MIAADTREPIRKARVDLLASVGDRRDPVYADSEGRFQFTALAPGRYTLSAWKSGFALTTLGARTRWEPPAVIAVEPGQAIEGVEIALAKGAAISGRVLDDAGEPLADAQVTAGAAVPVNGRLEFRSMTRASTDDRGEYRIGGLAPGAYVVSVSGRMRTTFYPQAAFLSQARSIPLRAGEEIGSIDVALTGDTFPAATVSGRVIDPGGAAVEADVVVASSGDAASAIMRSLTTMLQQGGEFSVRLAPGSYTITAQTAELIATTQVTVDRSDITGLELSLVKGARVSGRVVFDGTSPRPASAFEVVPVAANRPADAAPMTRTNYRPARVRADGSFVILNLIGPIELRVVPANRGWRPKALLMAGRNLLDVPVEFKGGEDIRGVVIQMSDRTATLAGTLAGSSPASALSGASVLVFPYDVRQSSTRVRWVRPDQHGRFVVDDLAPGEYLVAAAADVDDLQWRSAAYLDRFRGVATRVTLADGETKMVALEWSESR